MKLDAARWEVIMAWLMGHLAMPGTEVFFIRVDLGTATSASDRNNILRH